MLSLLRLAATYASYPFTIGVGYAVFVYVDFKVATIVAAHIAVLVGAGLVTLHEWLVPYRKRWYPTRTDFVNDAAYMLIGQVFLERLLSLAGFSVVVAIAANTNWRIEVLWPYEWPFWGQAILVLIIGDLFRYWMHRAFHKFSWMWRLHAVHHSPKRLYWLNVGRFHPLEQSLQFLVDAIPFIALGVSAEVMSIYFVFYAINGYYQHSNCDVRLGFLNWFIAGPELHRWHHSVNLEESKHNFGNNLILWDIVFRTRYFPLSRGVGELGIPVKDYPMSFLRQLVAPFDSRILKRDSS